jgi:hypothetical protein
MRQQAYPFPHPFLYLISSDGDLIIGTKAELQALGIAADQSFPGEEGAPRKVLWATDPRGLKTRIAFAGDERYLVEIKLPERVAMQPRSLVSHALPNGLVWEKCRYSDVYRASLDILISSGVLPESCIEHLSTPERGKLWVLPDGQIFRHKARTFRRPPVGAKGVKKIANSIYEVEIEVGRAEWDAREEPWGALVMECEAKYERMPRPAPLELTPAAYQRYVESVLREAKTDSRFQSWLTSFAEP